MPPSAALTTLSAFGLQNPGLRPELNSDGKVHFSEPLFHYCLKRFRQCRLRRHWRPLWHSAFKAPAFGRSWSVMEKVNFSETLFHYCLKHFRQCRLRRHWQLFRNSVFKSPAFARSWSVMKIVNFSEPVFHYCLKHFHKRPFRPSAFKSPAFSETDYWWRW